MKQFLKKYPIISCISIISIIIYALQFTLNITSNINLLEVLCIDSQNFKTYQVFSHFVTHAIHPDHIMYNLTFFALYGMTVEKVYKTKLLYLILLYVIIVPCLLNIIYVDFNGNGLSAIVCAIQILHLFTKPDMYYDKILQLFTIYDLVKTILYSFIKTTDISNMAHLCGYICGIVFCICYFVHKKRGQKSPSII